MPVSYGNFFADASGIENGVAGRPKQPPGDQVRPFPGGTKTLIIRIVSRLGYESGAVK